MNDEQVTDLKEFMSAVITQQTSDLREDIKRLETKTDQIDKKIDTLSSSIVEAIDMSNDSIDEQMTKHEHRLIKLEHAKA